MDGDTSEPNDVRILRIEIADLMKQLPFNDEQMAKKISDYELMHVAASLVHRDLELEKCDAVERNKSFEQLPTLNVTVAELKRSIREYFRSMKRARLARSKGLKDDKCLALGFVKKSLQDKVDELAGRKVQKRLGPSFNDIFGSAQHASGTGAPSARKTTVDPKLLRENTKAAEIETLRSEIKHLAARLPFAEDVIAQKVNDFVNWRMARSLISRNKKRAQLDRDELNAMFNLSTITNRQLRQNEFNKSCKYADGVRSRGLQHDLCLALECAKLAMEDEIDRAAGRTVIDRVGPTFLDIFGDGSSRPENGINIYTSAGSSYLDTTPSETFPDVDVEQFGPKTVEITALRAEIENLITILPYDEEIMRWKVSDFESIRMARSMIYRNKKRAQVDEDELRHVHGLKTIDEIRYRNSEFNKVSTYADLVRSRGLAHDLLVTLEYIKEALNDEVDRLDGLALGHREGPSFVDIFGENIALIGDGAIKNQRENYDSQDRFPTKPKTRQESLDMMRMETSRRPSPKTDYPHCRPLRYHQRCVNTPPAPPVREASFFDMPDDTDIAPDTTLTDTTTDVNSVATSVATLTDASSQTVSANGRRFGRQLVKLLTRPAHSRSSIRNHKRVKSAPHKRSDRDIPEEFQPPQTADEDDVESMLRKSFYEGYTRAWRLATLAEGLQPADQ